MLSAALVTFAAFWILTRHLSPKTMRKVVGHKGKIDVVLHLTVILLFHGTFSGLMQAEAAAILFSCYLLFYRWAWGYERGGVRYAGRFTQLSAA